MRSPGIVAAAYATALFLCPALGAAWPTHYAADARKAAAANAAAASTPNADPGHGQNASATPSGAAGAGTPPVPYDKFVQGADVADGLFPLLRKEGHVYLTLAASQLDTDFYEHATTANGLGGYGILSGDDFDQEARIIRFTRVNEGHVAIVLPQYRFDARPGTPQSVAVANSTADSVLAVAPVVAEDRAAGKIVIDPAFLLGDTLDIGNRLSDIVDSSANPQGAYHLDPARTYFGPAKAFPRNDVIEADETFASAKPDGISTVADPHSIAMRVKYNFAKVFASPDYVPRLSDDRVGYFTTTHVNFDGDASYDDVQRFIFRWNLRASDPTRPSPAQKPLVFTLTNTIPAEYRAPIRTAILAWNKAFEKIGILGAIQVQDQPTDPAWDPDDIRYNTVRWLTEANNGSFAEAQFEWNPRTGEIFRAGILIDSDLMRIGKFQYADLVGPTSGSPTSLGVAGAPELWDPATLAGPRAGPVRPSSPIHRDFGARESADFGALALELGGDEVPASYSRDFLESIVLHEVGHDFGLQHNFIAANAYSAQDLKNRSFTRAFGLTSSVMSYSPVNLWPRGDEHGDYFMTTLGPYDYHAIHWGYAPVPGARSSGDETATLDRWASSSVDPKFAFASDEDVEFNGHAVDPRVAQWTLTNDNIAWCRTQFGIDRDLIRTLDVRYPRPEMPWDQERAAFLVLTGNYARCAQAMAHYIAGERISRARRGDPGAPAPLTPVSRDDEVRAYRNLDEFLFSDSAWQISPQTLRRTTYSEFASDSDIGDHEQPRHDVSLAALVSGYQNRALGYMFAPLVLQRLADLPTKSGNSRPMTLGDLFTWTQNTVYGDLASGRPARTMLHRNLQRSYARLLERLVTAPPPGTPDDAAALARHELLSLAGDIRRCTGHAKDLDLQTQSHLEALGDEVARALDTRDVHQVHD